METLVFNELTNYKDRKWRNWHHVSAFILYLPICMNSWNRVWRTLKHFTYSNKMYVHMLVILYVLTLSWRRPLSYRNQSIDLLCKSMDWFLYDNGLHHERVKTNESRYIALFVVGKSIEKLLSIDYFNVHFFSK